MPPQDPQIELQDSDGTVRGVVYINSNNEIVIRESAGGNEVVLQSDGTFGPSLSIGDVPISSWQKWALRNDVRDGGVYRLLTYKTMDNFFSNSSGSGGVSSNNFRILLDTGSTNGSTVELLRGISQSSAFFPSFDNDVEFRADYRIVDDDADRTDYVTTGRVESGDKGFGFKLADVGGTPTLQGVVHNGSSESTTDLISSPGATTRDVRAAFSAGSAATFHVDGTQEGSIDSGLPSGSYDSQWFFAMHITNTSAAQRRIQSSEFRWAMLA